MSLCDAALTSLGGTNGGRFLSAIISSQLISRNQGWDMISLHPFTPSLVCSFLSRSRRHMSAAFSLKNFESNSGCISSVAQSMAFSFETLVPLTLLPAFSIPKLSASSDRNGFVPEMNSARQQPKLNQSTVFPYGLRLPFESLRSISGAQYPLVPAAPCSVGVIFVASPRSVSLTRPSSPRRQFSGLRSLYTYPLSCSACRPSIIRAP
mmetsp:Transcript_19555/g.45892  ORF Transcript_19555/g.45892 Transcript_19555/m.45892 type:complete len:208 (+) Transcript_19555:1208-1831(+)